MMVQYNYKIWTSLALCFLLSVANLLAEGKEKFEKLITKEFPIEQNGTVSLLNKYGDVNVITGNFNAVKVDVKIIVNAGTQEKADAVFNRIHIEFSNSSNYVSAMTSISEAKKTSWWGSSTSCNSGDFEIHYEVQMPQSNNLQLNNKYGNTYVGELHGEADIIVKYGSLKMEDVRNHLKLDMGYGKGNIGDTQDLTLVVKYSTLHFENTNDVNAASKYSNISISQADKMVLVTKYDKYSITKVNSFRNEGKYDHFHIDEVIDLDANSKYTDFKVGYLDKNADFDLQYGGAVLSQVGAQFANINIEGRYTDYKLNVEDGANYQLDVEGDYAGIRYPSAMQVVHKVDDGTEKEIEGFLGGEKSGSKIKARLQYGSIKVDEY